MILSTTTPPFHHRNLLRSRQPSCVLCLDRGQSGKVDQRGPGDAPPPLRLAVAAVTELLRAASPKENRDGYDCPFARGEGILGEKEEATCVLCADDVIALLRADYGRAYFLTGNFNSEIYSEDCLYEDPTISFRGREQYAKNLKLLVPFFVLPSLTLESIKKGVNGDLKFIQASWKLRTFLKLPWRPLIYLGGTTIYELDQNLKIVRHSESWDISALEAVGQIFTPYQ